MLADECLGWRPRRCPAGRHLIPQPIHARRDRLVILQRSGFHLAFDQPHHRRQIACRRGSLRVRRGCLRSSLNCTGLCARGDHRINRRRNDRAVRGDHWADGANLARTQDVVVVSLNHRVGPLGFSNFAGTDDPTLAASANLGMLDIVHALRWISRNIAGFGGDPARVTLFGASGGGFKISVLLAMPEARGLFHGAIIQSGARLAIHSPPASDALGSAVLEQLGIAKDASAGERLRSMPLEEYLKGAGAASQAVATTRRAAGASDWAPPAHWFEPTAGMTGIPFQPFSPQAVALSTHIPLICGTVKDEAAPGVNAPETERLGWEELATRLGERWGSRAPAAMAAARREYPDKAPVDILSIIGSYRFRKQALEASSRMSAAGAPIWNYVFDWPSPLFGGRSRAFHTSDVAFAFYNTDLVDTQTGGGEQARALAKIMSTMWANLARKGNPNGPGLPDWPRHSPDRPATLVFDLPIGIANGRDEAWTRALAS